MTTLRIRNFAQIADVNLDFGDLTVLVGAQGTGKTLALEWLKAALDGKQVVNALKVAGHDTSKPQVVIDLVFGAGMGSAWKGRSRVELDQTNIKPENLSRRGDGTESLFFIPAQRSLLISDGWPQPFQRLTSDLPVVARLYSQNLFDRFSAKQGDQLFPLERVLKQEYRTLIDEAVYHGGAVGLEQDQSHARRLKLTHGRAQLPFMAWTAGQREFTPLLLGLYHLLPSRQVLKQPDIDWVVVEEPEMGLHPQAITVFLLLVLDLLWRGYRVVLSTHSPHLLTGVWMLKRLQEAQAKPRSLCEALGVAPTQAMQDVAAAALKREYRVHLMAFGNSGRVTSTDISSLDPGADDDATSGWGGLTSFSSRFGEAVRKAVNS